MFLKRKILVITSLLLFVCIVAVSSAISPAASPTSVTINNKPKIILDAGHGGFDGGAVASDGTVEKDINLSICLYLAELL